MSFENKRHANRTKVKIYNIIPFATKNLLADYLI